MGLGSDIIRSLIDFPLSVTKLPPARLTLLSPTCSPLLTFHTRPKAKMVTALSSFLLSLPLLASLVTAILHSKYIRVPDSRKIRPTSAHRVNGTVKNAASLTASSSDTAFHGVSAATYDFSKNFAGSFRFTSDRIPILTNLLGLPFLRAHFGFRELGAVLRWNALARVLQTHM